MVRFKIASIATSVALAVGALFGGIAAATTPTAPHTVEVKVTGVDCPEEDSCELDYRHGSWYVREVQP
jgi:hypothetical protein